MQAVEPFVSALEPEVVMTATEDVILWLTCEVLAVVGPHALKRAKQAIRARWPAVLGMMMAAASTRAVFFQFHLDLPRGVAQDDAEDDASH